MIKQTVFVVAFFLSVSGYGQKYFTKTAEINFDATTPTSPEKITGVNRTATCVIDSKTGKMQFAILMKSFLFEKALMTEHFNENYVESHKFPKAEFKGEIKNISEVNFSKDGNYSVKIKGILSMHGESKDIETTAKISIVNGKITANAVFDAPLADYKITIPGLVADKVAKIAKITVSCALELLKS